VELLVSGAMTRAYPLGAARTLRQVALDEATHELGQRSAEVVVAQEAVDRAEAALRAHGERTEVARAREASLDSAGRSAADMVLGRDYLRRLDEEERRLVDDTLRSQKGRLDATAREDEARTRVAEARAALEAVEQHRERWLAEQSRAAEAREEAEAEDVVASRHREH